VCAWKLAGRPRFSSPHAHPSHLNTSAPSAFMQTPIQAHEAAQEEAAQHQAKEPSLGLAVLTNALILEQLWAQLERDDKRRMRAVSRAVRASADGAVSSLDMQARRSLAASLARFPGISSLKAPCYDHDCARVLSAAPLPRLRALDLLWNGVSNGHAHGVIVPCSAPRYARVVG
jgi:hypothetical protein